MKRRKLLIATATLGAGLVVGAIYWPRRWHYIVIHHSAGNYGDIEFLQRVHRERQARDPIDAIPYHYVIGNGNGLEMGEIASDWRQKYDIWGTHVSGNNRDRNFRGLGICLIGNFEVNQVPEKQYQALLALTKDLMQCYGIDVSNVDFHGKISGESTQCPGKNFPVQRLHTDLRA